METTPHQPGSCVAVGERLSKRIAQMMHCSRREAEQYIEGGWVQVNGQVIEQPMIRVTDSSIVVDSKACLMDLTDVTLLLHKPAGCVAMDTNSNTIAQGQSARQLLHRGNHASLDASGDRVLQRHFAKLTACIPLETAASGLVVFTQDGRILRKLTEDAQRMEHEFRVEVQGQVAANVLQQLNTPSDSGTSSCVKVSINSTGEASTHLRFVFKGSHPGLVADRCDRAQLRIISMKRLRVGRIALAQLPEGQWRYLTDHERF